MKEPCSPSNSFKKSLVITTLFLTFTADLDTKEIDAINSTEQENVGQKMDVYQSLKMLKEVERTCIMLFYMEDISIDKIAGIVGVPSGTVKSHLSRGKEKLATYLKQNGYDRNRQ